MWDSFADRFLLRLAYVTLLMLLMLPIPFYPPVWLAPLLVHSMFR
jgi:hypothetical protein